MTRRRTKAPRAGTENPEMRHRLQRKQNILEGILTRLQRKAAA